MLESIAWWFGPSPSSVPYKQAQHGLESNAGEVTIHIACAVDENYAPHCAAMLHSLLSHSSGLQITIHFLHPPNLPKSVLERMRNLLTSMGADFWPTAVDDELVQGLHSTECITKVAWYRSLLPILRPNLTRILYLDCDTLIVDSILPLWKTDISNSYVAAIQNVFEPTLENRHMAVGLPNKRPYFNSGVLLMNLDLMRRDECVKQILGHAREHGPRLIWVDQDSLNMVLGAKCRLLHPRWNCQNSLFYWRKARDTFGKDRVEEATSNPAILHFEGPGLAKPWNYLCKHPYRNYYYHHLAQTPWPVQQPRALDWKNYLLRLLPMRITPHAISVLRNVKQVLRKVLLLT